MNISRRPVSISFAPNFERDDIYLAARLMLGLVSKKRVSLSIPTFKKRFSKYLGVGHVSCFSSARAGLYYGLRSLGLKKGDEVILQAYTCVAVPGAIKWAGLTPVFVDIDPQTYNFNIKDLKKKITIKTKVIIIQHTFGIPGPIKEVQTLAKHRGLYIIEDCAHSLGSEYEDKKLGTFGDIAVFSFNRDKIISCVQGGGVTTNNKQLANNLSLYEERLVAPPTQYVLQQLYYLIIYSISLPIYNLFIGKCMLWFSRRFSLLSRAVYKEEYDGGKPKFLSYQLSPQLGVLLLNQLQKLNRFTRHRTNISKIYIDRLGLNMDPHPYLRVPYVVEDKQITLMRAKNRGLHLGNWYRSPIDPSQADVGVFNYQSNTQAELLARITINLPTHIGISKRDADKIIDFIQHETPNTKRRGFVVKPIKNRGVWRGFVLKNTKETFHQSWEWGELQKAQNNNVWRIGVYKKQQLVAVALVVKIVAKRGSFLLVPHGPIVSSKIQNTKYEILKILSIYLIQLGKDEKCGFIRIAPVFGRNKKNEGFFKTLGYRKAPIFIQSEQSWILDISLPKDILLKNMRKSTRYIIRRENKYGVRYLKSTSLGDFRMFYKLYTQTVSQQKFHGYGAEYIEQEYKTFLDNNNAALYFVIKDSRPLAGALIITQNKTGYYHYGASIQARDNIPAPHLLQWFIIQDLKRNNIDEYNFWGIAPDNKPKHPWKGLSVFKKGFGGEEREYLQTYDYPLQWTYWLNWVIETTRRIKRNY